MKTDTLPTEVADTTWPGGKAKRLFHPAFGNVTVAQWHMGGNGQRMYGSDLLHNTGIRITLKQASTIRELSSDYIMGAEHIAEFELSLSQWARLVASVGNGSGVPVTLVSYRDGNGRLFDAPGIAAPAASKRELHGEEMAAALKDRLDTMRELVDRLGNALDGQGGGKKMLRQLHSEMARHVGQLPGHVQFIHDQFAEATERVVEDAKTEVEGHVNMMAVRLGLEQLRQMAPALNDGTRNGA